MATVVLASAAGGGTALLVASGGGEAAVQPFVSGVPPRTMEAEQENARLREDVRRLQAEVAEARLQAAAARAFPDENPRVRAGAGGPPADAILDELSPEERAKFDRYWRALQERERRSVRRSMTEADLRARLERGFAEGTMDGETREKVIGVVLESAERMQALVEKTAREGGDRKGAAAEAEAIGAETRKRLGEFLSPAQLETLDAVLGEPPAGAASETGR